MSQYCRIPVEHCFSPVGPFSKCGSFFRVLPLRLDNLPPKVREPRQICVCCTAFGVEPGVEDSSHFRFRCNLSGSCLFQPTLVPLERATTFLYIGPNACFLSTLLHHPQMTATRTLAKTAAIAPFALAAVTCAPVPLGTAAYPAKQKLNVSNQRRE